MDYDYIKDHYRSTAIYLCREKKLDVDPKAIQQIEFVGQIKNIDGIKAGGTQKKVFLKILENSKETRLTFSQGSVTVL